MEYLYYYNSSVHIAIIVAIEKYKTLQGCRTYHVPRSHYRSKKHIVWLAFLEFEKNNEFNEPLSSKIISKIDFIECKPFIRQVRSETAET